jgi:hypothetical protein
MQDENVYSYQPETNTKAKVRSIAIVSAGSLLGIGLIASTALGIGGANEEVSIIEKVQAKVEQKLSGADHNDFEPVAPEVQPTEAGSDSQPQVTQMGTEPTVLAPLVAPGFTPQEDDDEEEDEDYEEDSAEHDSDEDDDDDEDED